MQIRAFCNGPKPLLRTHQMVMVSMAVTLLMVVMMSMVM
jgi:hypothetical protein